MRWIRFLILVYLVTVVQTTLVRLLAVDLPGVGTVAPDLLAMVAVFVALRARHGLDCMLAGWLLGLAADLTSGGWPGWAPLGGMPITYSLAAGMIHRVREGFFRERPVTQAVMTGAFCLLAHGLWITVQSILARRFMSWDNYAWLALQVTLVATYTALVMPLVGLVLAPVQGHILSAHAGRSRRY